MARKPVSAFKRPMTRKGQSRYYIKLWDAAAGRYMTAHSTAAVALELGLSPMDFPSGTRTGA